MPTLFLRGIFWKILLLFWLSSSLIIISGGFISALEISHERQRWQQSKNLERYAQRVIQLWELRQHSQEQKAKRQYLRELRKLKKRWHKLPPLRLVDADSNTVLWGQGKAFNANNTETLNIESNSGRRYQLLFPKARRIKALPLALKQLFSLRLLVALILSCLFSALLSLLLSRPINRLKRHIDMMAKGHLDIELEQNLSERGDEIGQLARSFELMSERLSEMLGSKQTLLSQVSHELRAPLARLQVAATLIEEDSHEPEQQQLAERIGAECQHLDQLISQILQYSKLSEPAAQQHRQTLELRQQLEAAIDNGRFLAPERHFSLSSSDHLNSELLIDQNHLTQIVENLINNAIKYGLGDIELTCFRDQQQHLCFSIRDHGPGFDGDKPEQLLQPFERGDRNASAKQGFGLGLSIAARACERENADLSLANHPNGGAVVTVCFNTANTE